MFMQSEHKKEFNKLLDSLSHGGWHKWDVFRDFCDMAAITLAQTIYKDAEMEKEYLRIAGKYKKEEVEVMPKMLGCVVMGLKEQPHDFLGEIFMENGMGSHFQGQYFTPWNVCSMMAKMILGSKESLQKTIDEKGFIYASEPCSGSGAMVIAMAEAMKEEGFDISKHLFFQTIDVSHICWRMCYIQLAILGIPASVINGDTLVLKTYHSLYTPAIRPEMINRQKEESSEPIAIKHNNLMDWCKNEADVKN